MTLCGAPTQVPAVLLALLSCACAPAPLVSVQITTGITFAGLVDADGDGALDVPEAVTGLDACNGIRDGVLSFCDCADGAVADDGALLPIVDINYRGDGLFAEHSGDELLHVHEGHLIVPIQGASVDVLAAYRHDAPLYSVSADGQLTAIDSDASVAGDTVTADYAIGDRNVTVHEVHNLARSAAPRPIAREDAGSLTCNAGCSAGGPPRPLVVVAVFSGLVVWRARLFRVVARRARARRTRP